jgi:serine/threonine-protein kinase
LPKSGPASGKPLGPLAFGSKIPRPAATPAGSALPISDRSARPGAEQETLTVERINERPTTSDFPDQDPVSQVKPLVSAPGASAAEKYLGAVIDGRYKVLEVLGEGGMGVVYRCRRRIFDNEVAVKILRSDFAKDPEATERFVTEAKAASAIGHAHIVNVIDFGELPDGSVYFAMEYLGGRTLGELIESGELLGSPRIAHIGRQIAEGLAAAHQAGIVHRDLKPDNVFIIQRDGDFVKILDFGIAKVVGVANKITRAGAIFGTPHYMSPEQCRGTAVDERTDIYALGVLLYEMVTGRPPFDADSPLAILSQHLNEPLRPPSQVEGVPELPAGIEAVILKCLAKDAEDRFQKMSLVAHALAGVERGDPAEELPLTISLDSSMPPPADDGPEAEARAHMASAPFLLSRRSLVPSEPTPPSASAPVSIPASAPGSRPTSPATLTAIVDDADVEAFKKASRGRRTQLVLGGVALFAIVAWATHGLWLPEPKRLPEALEAGRPVVVSEHARVVPPPESKKSDAKSVALVLSPIDAKVYRDKELLGTMPLSVDVKPGELLKLTVKREGFWSRKIVVDGAKSKVLVRLAPIPGHRLKVPVPKAPGGAETKGADEAIDDGAGEASEPAPKPTPAGKDKSAESKGDPPSAE